MARYFNPFTDYGFKRLFGQEDSKVILIGFLNALFEGEFVVKDVAYRDKEQLGDREDRRNAIYDVYCTTDRGSHFILEMQNKSQEYFEDRALYYASKSIARQGTKGGWNFRLDAVFGVYFLNFTQPILGDDFRSDFGIRRLGMDEPQNLQQLSDKLRLVFLQLPLFTKTQEECKTRLDKWTYIMKNLATTQDVPWRAEEEAFEAIAKIADFNNMTEEERNRYEDAQHALWDAYATYEFERKQGRDEERRKIALELMADGFSNETIAKYTKLSLDEIQKLREQ